MRRLAPFVPLFVLACGDAPDQLTAPETSGPAFARVESPRQVPAFQPGVVVLRLADGAATDVATAIATERGASSIRRTGSGAHVMRVAPGRERAIVRELEADPRVRYAELSVPRTLGVPCGLGDCVVPADNLFGLRWDLHNDGSINDSQGNVLWTSGLVPDADSDWLEAFDRLGAFTGSARVGVIDTGIFGDHPDLLGRLVAQYDFFNVDPIADDDNGHGTHVSGIVLARGNNGMGTPGIAYGANLSLVVAKGCGLVTFLGYICWSPDIADGIVWAVDNGANVINLSLGGDEGSAVEQEALQYALANDVLPVCAAGNDQSDVDFPGAFPECVAVSATDWADQLSSYSSFGPEVEVAAPGGDILHPSAYDRIASTWNDGTYVYAAGTSMASPHVAGLAALLHALGVTSAAEKRQIIRSSADDLGTPGFDPIYGNGRVNVWNAVLAALGEPPPPPPPNQAPTASFTASCTDNACSFTDASTDPDGFVASWSWDFGDGTTSSTQSPSRAYATAGTYDVVLTVTDNGGLTSVAGQSVTVTDPPPNQPPVAAFGATCTNLTCTFTDQSTDAAGSVVAWSWDFGDGATSTAQSPTRTYAAAGTYTVTLTVTDDGGLTGVTQQSVTATDPPPNQPPVVGFTYSCTELACAFTNTSTDPDGSIVAYQWTFGDGWATNAPNPDHTYAAEGTYTVTLSARDNGGLEASTQQSVTVTDPTPPPPNQLPTADFTFACDELTCVFTNTSTDPDGSIVSRQWTFGDGSGTNAVSPTYTYGAAGTYTVTLSVTDDRGGSDATQQVVVVDDPTPPPPNQPPVAGFTFVCTNLVCSFTDASTDPDGTIVARQWTFGDGAATNAPSPTHTYAAAGTYTVTLSVTDDRGGTDSEQQSVTVTAPANQPPVASFTYGCTDLTCSFTNTSSDPDGSIVTRQWIFGDGGGSNAVSPTYTYAAAGTYTVRLTVVDNGGASDATEQTVTVTAPPPPPPNQLPTAGFTYACTDLVCSFSDASSDPDGSIVSRQWTFGDGSGTNAINPTYGYAAAGTYTVTLSVTDDRGGTDIEQQSVTVTAPPPPPPNQLPTASFTYACNDLVCSFSDASSDPDGSIVARQWTFGDGSATNATNPTYTYAWPGTYTVVLSVTDDRGGTGSTQETITVGDPSQVTLTLTATTRRVRRHTVDLAWTGTSADVDVYRDGALIATVPSPRYTDRMSTQGSATYTYRVCLAGTSTCSNEVTVFF